MLRRTSLALLLAASLCGAGCGTVQNVRCPTFPPPEAPGAPVCRVYGGVRGDWAAITDYHWGQTPLYVDYVALPLLAGGHLLFSLVGDTFTLPYTIYEEARRAFGTPPASSGFEPVIVLESAPATPPAPGAATASHVGR